MSEKTTEPTAIILAAGLSSRMGAFKPLLEIGGEPALLRLLDSIRAAGLRDIIVVTGHEAPCVEEAVMHYAEAREGEGVRCFLSDKTEAALPRPEVRADAAVIIRMVRNPDFESGMFSSVQAGLRAVPAQEPPAENDAGDAQYNMKTPAFAQPSAGALLFPADVPLVTPETIRAVLAAVQLPAFERNTACPGAQAAFSGDRFFRPAASPLFAQPICRDENFQDRNGHPLWIAASVFDEVLSYKGDGGLKAVRDLHGDRLLRILTDDEGCVLEMDTPEDFQRLQQYAGRGTKELSLPAPPFPPRIFLVRHGEPKQHTGRIFLGQTDVPLSERGREEARAAGKKLLRANAHTARVYTSDLTRARETAEAAAEILGAEVVPDKLFREMDMGSWDGELIEDIKAKFPEEYARRGDDILNYRIPGGENFYELRARVTHEFYRIWQAERAATEAVCTADASLSQPSRDLIIVAHLGVIRALVSEIRQDTDDTAFFRQYATGSVTALDAPDWLL